MGERRVGKYERLAKERHARDLALAAQPGGHPRGLWFDAAAAERVVRFVEHYCRHYEGEWAGQKIRLEEWQKRDVIYPIFGWKNARGLRRFRTAYIELGRKNGKALALDTPIPTPSGWATMGELVVGDTVFDENGEPAKVLATTGVQEGRPCFRVSFSDGTSIVADAEHEWFTEAKNSGLPRTGLGPKSTWRQKHIRTTRQIRESLKVSPGSTKTEWNHRIPCAGPIQTPHAELPVPPYTLGAWLGDGNTGTAHLTVCKTDAEIPEAIRAEGVSVAAAKSANPNTDYFLIGSNGRSSAGRRSSLQATLRRTGLIGNKHIPAVYLRAAPDQRLALLRGLMDTDGSALKSGQCEFTTTTPALRDGVLELLRSLGFKPSMSWKQPKITGRPEAVCAPAWRIQFWAFKGDAVFGLSRKLARLKSRPTTATRSCRRQIVGVEPVPSVPVRCIQASSPSSLFLAGESMVPTHNSFLTSALALYLLVADGEPGAQVYSSATKEEQARIVWRGASEMVKRSPDLKKYIREHKSKGGTLYCDRTSGFFKPLGADSETLDGLNPHAQVIDELHAHADPRLWNVLTTAMGARRQPINLVITTAGTYDAESIGWQQHQYGQDILDGAFEDDTFFAFICAIDEDDDPLDPENWGKANPNLGISVKVDDMQQQATTASRQASFYNDFLRLRLNRWTQQVSRWLSVEQWRDCEAGLRPEAALECREQRELALVGRECFAGLDLSSKLDLTALVLAFPSESGFFSLICRFWLPEATVEAQVKKGKKHYEQWVRDGWITTTHGQVIDYEFVRAEIVRLRDRYRIREIAFDPHNATQVTTALRETDGFETVEFRQGFLSMSEPAKALEAKIAELKVRHGGNPVLAWNVGNAVIKRDAAGNIKPDKEKAKDKIDGVIAMAMAMGRAEVAPPQGGSYLEDGPMVTLA